MKYQLFKTRSILAISLLAAAPLQAANFTTSVNQGSGATWNDAIWNPGGVAPTAGNTYEAVLATPPVALAPLLRSPKNGSSVTFNGDSLMLNVGTQVRLKGFNVPADMTINFGPKGLILNGGFVGNGDDMTAILPAMFSVIADSGIYAGQDATAGSPINQQRQGVRAFVFSGPFVGNGNLTLGNAVMSSNIPNFRFTSPNSSFSGSVTVTAGWLQLGALGAMGTGDITIAGGNNYNGVGGLYGVNGPARFNATVPYYTTGRLTISNSDSILLLSTNLSFGSVSINGFMLENGIYTADQINQITGGTNVVDTNVPNVNTLLVGATEIAPEILNQTSSMTNDYDSTVRLEVTASGTSLHYQWMAGAIGGGVYTNLVDGPTTFGATNAVLTINNATPSNQADYIVVVSNMLNSVRSVVPTTVRIRTLVLDQQSITNLVLYAGGTARLSIDANGVQPFSFQWFKNSVSIPGATNSSLVISNLAASNAGTYYVVVSNALASATGQNIILTLMNAPDGNYAQALVAKGPLAYWRFSETAGTNAYDYAGGHTADYSSGTLFPPGPSQTSFGVNNQAIFTQQGVISSVVLPASAGLNLNTNTVTISAWVRSVDFVVNAGIVMQRDASGVAGLIRNSANGHIGYNWNNDAATYGWDSGLTMADDTQWNFLNLVVTPTNATIYVYNSEGLSSATFVHNHDITPFSGTISIGDDPQDAQRMRTFSGDIDEVAIFNRALSAGEVASLYTAATGVSVPPGINSQSQSKSVLLGDDVQFAVSATGSEPLTYRWQRNGANISNQTGKIAGANTASLSVNNVRATNNGTYTVIISNAGGSITSSPAMLMALATDYDAGLMALNPLGYWRLNELTGTNAADVSGNGLNGTYGTGVTLGGSGPNPPFGGFDTHNGDVLFQNSINSYVSLPTLNLNSANVTFTAWIYPTVAAQSPTTGLVFWRDESANAKSSGFCFAKDGMSLSYNWNDDTNLWNYSSGLVVPSNQWSFVALVVTPVDATFYLYNTNGLSSAINTYSVQPAAFDGSVRIGSDSLVGGTRNFVGRIGEVALFNSSLNLEQINSLYANGSIAVPAGVDLPQANLSVGKSGANVQITWSAGMLLEATNVMGTWRTNSSATSPYIVTPGNQKFYRVRLQ